MRKYCGNKKDHHKEHIEHKGFCPRISRIKTNVARWKRLSHKATNARINIATVKDSHKKAQKSQKVVLWKRFAH